MSDTLRELQVAHDVAKEQRRQRALKKDGKFEYIAGESSDQHALIVLMEEVGEVARAVNDGEPSSHLYEELIQVAAVAQSHAKHVLKRGEPSEQSS